MPDTIAQRVLACTACHGREGRATSDGYFPRIAGKPAGYLYNQLVNFRDGRRSNAPMTYLVEHLSDDYLREIAGYFAALDLPYPPPQTAQRAAPRCWQRGAALVRQGDAARGVPACVACHGARADRRAPGDARAARPAARLPERASSAPGAPGSATPLAPDCMAQIARRLSADDIERRRELAGGAAGAGRCAAGRRACPAPLPLRLRQRRAEPMSAQRRT